MNVRQVADAGPALRPNLKVMFITGYAKKAVFGHDRLDHGMQFITKPFAIDALARTVCNIIDSSQSATAEEFEVTDDVIRNKSPLPMW